MAQGSSNVFSVNIVGYVNTVFKGDGAYTLVANPLNNGTNDLVSLVDAVLPNKSQVLVWDAASQSYTTASKSGGTWNTNLTIAPGVGFFVKTPTGTSDVTNTFVGNVVSATFSPGSTNTVGLPAGYYLSGSPIPFSGQLTDVGANSLNLDSVLPNKSQVLAWDANSQSYITASRSGGNWNTNLQINVGQAVFIKSAAATNWNQILQ
jgi:hypothetical protein